MSDETWKRYCDAIHELRELRQQPRIRNRRLVALPAAPVPKSLNVSQDALRAGGAEDFFGCGSERPHSKGR